MKKAAKPAGPVNRQDPFLPIESGYYGDHEIFKQCVEMKRLLAASVKAAGKNRNCAGAGSAPVFLCPY